MISTTIEAGDDLPLTLPKLLRRRAAEHGDRILLHCDDERLSYEDAEVRSRRIAKGLLAMGVAKGAHVALLFPNGADFVTAAFAIARIGAVVLPISTMSTPDEVRWILANSDSCALLATRRFRSHEYAGELATAIPELDFTRRPPLHSATAPHLRRVWFADPAPEGADAAWTMADLLVAGDAVSDALLEAVEARVTPADRLVIIHTSGSTSAPKGVMHSHGAQIPHINNLNQIRRFTPEDTLFSNSPFFWIGGFSFTLLGALLAGGRLLCSNATAPADVMDLLEREKPTMTNGYAQTVAKFALDPTYPKRDFSSARRGNLYTIMAPEVRPRDPELRHNMFGMTETGSTFVTHEDEGDIPERLRGSYGKFAPGYEHRIVDPESGKECAPGEVGELWLRGPFMMDGYYGRPRSQVFDVDGWYHSGDMGAVDAEGHFYFKGRRGDMIKTSGANVSPREVEAVLRPLTGDKQCLVLGVPDPQRGQAVVAVVIAESDADVDEAGLQAQLTTKLSKYKVPRRVVRLPQAELPVMSSGKVEMRRLQQIVAERLR